MSGGPLLAQMLADDRLARHEDPHHNARPDAASRSHGATARTSRSLRRRVGMAVARAGLWVAGERRPQLTA